MSPQTIPLSDLAVGTHALISKMGDDPHLCYLRCIGFCPGAHVELIRSVSGGALSVYRVDDADVALRGTIGGSRNVVNRSINCPHGKQ